MNFWKMNGAGNDFIIINNLKENLPLEVLPEVARTLCERHMSIGADGFMAVGKPSDGVNADARMLFYNSDGSIGEMCGNGARCISRYCLENGIGNGEEVVLETTAGIVSGRRIDKQLYRVRLNDPSVIELSKDLVVDGNTINCSYVVLGDPGIPHLAVNYTTEVAQLCGGAEHLFDADRNKLFELGRKLRFHADLANGANVNFYEIIGENEIDELTYERGVEDFTYACGTGTGSMVTALTLMEKANGEAVKVNVLGGTLYIDVEEIDMEEAADSAEESAVSVHGLYLTGPTNIVCKGEVTDESLKI